MATQPFRIPETPDYVGFARQNAMLDFSPINNAVSGLQQQQQRDVENKLAEDQLGFQRERLGMDKEKFSDDQKKNVVETFGNLARLYDPAKDLDGSKWTGIVKGYEERMRARDPSFSGVTPNYYDRVQGPSLILGEAKMAAQQLEYERMKAADVRASEQLQLNKDQSRAQIEASGASAKASDANAQNIGKTDSIREFLFATKPIPIRNPDGTSGYAAGYTGSYDDWRKVQETNSNRYGLNPIAYKKLDGSIGYYVTSSSGQTRDLEIPAGGTALPPVSTVNLPDQIQFRDKFGNLINSVAKNIAGAEIQKEQGQSQGKAIVDLPGVEMRAQLMNEALDAVEAGVTANPRMTGAYTGRLPNVTGTARDVQSKIDQVQGKVFLQAYDSLRGAGAISEGEGKPATAAISRLQEAAVGTTQYLAAIKDVRKEITALVAIARKKAGGGAASGGGWSIQKVQ